MMTDEPDSLYEAIRALPVKARNQLVFRLLRAAGVPGLVIEGRQGTVEGFTSDETVALKYLKNGVWSPAIVGLACGVFRQAGQGSYIDLGANIGLTTIPVARLDRVACYAVEADPDNYALLRRNLARNGLASRVETCHAAIVAEPGPVELEKAPTNLGDHRVRYGVQPADTYRESSRATLTVPGRTLDDVIPASALAGPVVLKMDIQGAEPLALEGGHDVLAKTDLLLTEYWPYGLRRMPLGVDAFQARLAEAFDWGAVLADGQDPDTVVLRPIDEVLDGLADVDRDNPINAIDLALARSARILP
ncbi:MAG: FkbM family methyltransferase [Alphaproteobacteria bacterium]|nr:FkbM family methyltransferase [Alphaproteobacteria bacterium]